MTTSGALPPAGWYPDPADPAKQRWWNGAAWTDQTTAAPAATGSQPYGGGTEPTGFGSGEPGGYGTGGYGGYGSGGYQGDPGPGAVAAASGTGYSGPPVLVVTTEQAPGHQVTKVIGEVAGIGVRPRAGFAAAGATFAAGSEAAGYAALLGDCRREAIEALRAACHDAGGNAVLAVRISSADVADYLFQTTAYGTAVTVDPAPEPG
jgi:uncharacterized protein YbjQ (UPF0145 family)